MGGVVGKIFKGIVGVALVVAGALTGNFTLIATGISIGASVLAGRPATPKVSGAIVERLNASIDPRAPRKSGVGITALNTDIRDQEYTEDQTYLDRFIVVAAHKINAFREIWFDDKLAWTSGAGVQGEFFGYLTVDVRTEGTAANAINISPRAGSTRRYTGCAYVRLRFRLTGLNESTDSPFAQSVPTRLTIVGEAAFIYDPRQDSTVPGGSGALRANNQATWIWDQFVARNPALQLLWYLLGWRINGELSVGLGIPPERIDMESFITAANLCDEPVTLVGGGTEPRYRSDAVWSEGDDPQVVVDMLKTAMNADLDDVGGKLRLTVFHNDLATPVATFTDDDIVDTVEWNQTPALDQTFNIVRGLYTDASNNSLYQAVDYPEVELASIDGIDRIDSFNLPAVQSASQAQRLAKQRLQRQQYGGELRTVLDIVGWKVLKNDVIRLTLPVFGWTNKLFRVAEIEFNTTGTVPIVLREENAAIYAWDADESPAVQAAAPTLYDRALNPIIQAIETDIPAILANQARYGTTFPLADDSEEGNLFIRTDLGNRLFIRIAGDGLISIGGSDITLGGDTIYLPPWMEVSDQRVIAALAAAAEAKAVADAAIAAGIIAQALANDAQATADGKVQTFYQTSPPTAEAVGDLWIDTDDGNKLYRWNGSAWVDAQDDAIGDAITAAAGAQATADGKVTTFYTTSTPTAEAVGDLWFNPTTGYLKRWSGSAWVDVANIGATAAQIAQISQALTDASNAQTTADGKIETYYQSSPPSGGSLGDLWFDTDDANKVYRHDGTTWVLTRDTGIATAITAAAGAQATADGKVVTFTGGSPPTAEGIGDLWVNTSDQNKLYRWDGSSWVLVRDAGADAADNGLNGDGTVKPDKVNIPALQDGTTGAFQSMTTNYGGAKSVGAGAGPTDFGPYNVVSTVGDSHQILRSKLTVNVASISGAISSPAQATIYLKYWNGSVWTTITSVSGVAFNGSLQTYTQDQTGYGSEIPVTWSGPITYALFLQLVGGDGGATSTQASCILDIITRK